MICSRHPDRETEVKCNSCNSPLCEGCQVKLGNEVFCRECIERILASSSESQNSCDGINQVNNSIGVVRPGEKKSRFWTFVFSLVPGVGYLYLGLMKRGLQALVTFFGTIFIGNMIGLEQIIALVLPVLMFYTIFDSQQVVRKINAGEEVIDEQLFPGDWFNFEQRWIGYALIGLGTLALFDNVLSIFSTYWFRSAVGPLAVIGAGVFILYRNIRRD